jgi:hypothetical protein
MGLGRTKQRAATAAVAVVLGAATSAAVSLATTNPSWLTLVGLVVVVVVFASMEWWRAALEKSDTPTSARPRIEVSQKVGRLHGGSVTGIRGAPRDADASVRQRVRKLDGEGDVIGYADDGDH